MFHNYFFLKKLSEDLQKELPGMLLLECFSQNKDELILGFASGQKERYIRATLEPQISLLDISDDFKRARKNSVDLFNQLINEKVTSVGIFLYERSFFIKFENNLQLIFKMHGSRSNILLADDQKVHSIFRNSLPGDQEIIPADLHKNLSLDEERFEEVNGDPKAFLPALGKEVNAYLKDQGYFEASTSHQWSIMQAILKQLDEAHIKIYQGDLPSLSLLTQDLTCELATNDAIEACHFFYSSYTKKRHLYDAQKAVGKPLEAAIKKTESYLSKTQEKLSSIKSRRGYDEIANILMANLHQIPKGQKSVDLDDLYGQGTVSIKLNPELSPQKNAENLYRKAKNQQKEINTLEENIALREEKLLEMMRQLEEIEASDSIKEIRGLKPQKIKTQKDQIITPYHEFDFMGYKILVGKNARHNDELTLKIATKNDLWLHAKDVPGSHVIIRNQAGKNYPRPVIEYAAELAAWYSKRKTDSLCPVIYTPKKFIRKRKGDPAGAVIVTKEEILIVEPKNH